jgi:hypothetical protein
MWGLSSLCKKDHCRGYQDLTTLTPNFILGTGKAAAIILSDFSFRNILEEFGVWVNNENVMLDMINLSCQHSCSAWCVWALTSNTC